MKDSSTTWRKRKQVLTRQVLMESAQDVFLRCGRQAATIQEMASTALCSPSLFYSYFPGKEALLREIAMKHADELFRTVVTQMRASQESLEGLHAGLRGLVCHVTLQRALFRLLVHEFPVWCDEHQRSVGTGPWHVMKDFAILTSELLQEAQRSRLVRTDFSVSELQEFINLVCIGLIERVATNPGEPDVERLAALVWELLCSGIIGKLGQPPTKGSAA